MRVETIGSAPMTRKVPKDGDSPPLFSAKDYWEELHDEWEGDLGEDALGADHVGRLAATSRSATSLGQSILSQNDRRFRQLIW